MRHILKDILNRPFYNKEVQAMDTFGTKIETNNFAGNSYNEKFALPLPPKNSDDTKFEMEVYARFMSHLRHVPNSQMEIKILSSIQFTADMLDCGDALVAKTLIDLGLRAPRKAFPVSFLDFVDKNVIRTAWDQGHTAHSIVSLNEHWDKTGENKFRTALRDHYAVYGENIYSRA